MRYAVSKIQTQDIDTAYRVYMADAIRMLTESNSRFAGGPYRRDRFADILTAVFEPPETRSGNEIAKEVIEKAGLVVTS